MAKRNPFEIDRNRLEEHLEEQPVLAEKHGKELSDLKYDLALAQDRLKVMEVEVANKIRLKPKKYKIKKVTETAIKEGVMMHKDVQNLRKLIIETQHDVDLATANMVAIANRKQALTDLTILHGQQYFAKVEPRKNRKND